MQNYRNAANIRNKMQEINFKSFKFYHISYFRGCKFHLIGISMVSLFFANKIYPVVFRNFFAYDALYGISLKFYFSFCIIGYYC